MRRAIAALAVTMAAMGGAVAVAQAGGEVRRPNAFAVVIDNQRSMADAPDGRFAWNDSAAKRRHRIERLGLDPRTIELYDGAGVDTIKDLFGTGDGPRGALDALLEGATATDEVIVYDFGHGVDEPPRPKDLAPDDLPAGASFQECDVCPEMVVIRVGSFLPGSPEDVEGDSVGEGPQRQVRIAAVAAGQHQVTYATRAGATTRYGWGDQWDASKANRDPYGPDVGKYPPTPFGPPDAAGGVSE